MALRRKYRMTQQTAYCSRARWVRRDRIPAGMDNHGKHARRVDIGAGARPFVVPRGSLGGRSRLTAGAWMLAVLSGVLQSLIYPLPGLTFLCWVALAPLLVAILRGRKPAVGGGDAHPVSAGQGFLLAYVGGVIWSFGTTYWIYHVMHIYGGLSGPTSPRSAYPVIISSCCPISQIHLIHLRSYPSSLKNGHTFY